MGRIGSLLLVAGLLIGVLWTARQARTGAINEGWAAEHNRALLRILNLAPGVELRFHEARPQPANGRVLALFHASDGETLEELELEVSSDGRLLFYEGRTYRLANPFADIAARLTLAGSPAWGLVPARVTVVEFSDYTCVYCRQFHLALEQPVRQRYAEQVRHIYKHFPMDPERPWGEEAAAAATCAFRQSSEAFWAYHGRLFQEAARLRAGRPVLLELARGVVPDLAAFSRCLDEGRGRDDVARDVREAQTLGVEATPTFFVNGRPVYGLVRPEYFFHILDEELAVARAE